MKKNLSDTIWLAATVIIASAVIVMIGAGLIGNVPVFMTAALVAIGVTVGSIIISMMFDPLFK